MAGTTAHAPTADPARSKAYTRRVGSSGALSSRPSESPQKAKGAAKSMDRGSQRPKSTMYCAPVSAA